MVTGLFGILVGFPSLRLKGPYLAIATLGFGIAVYQIFVNSTLLSGGRMGLAITKLSPLFGLSKVHFNFYFNLIIALLFTLLSYNIVSSYMGRAFIAIRDNRVGCKGRSDDRYSSGPSDAVAVGAIRRHRAGDRQVPCLWHFHVACLTIWLGVFQVDVG